MDEESPKSRFAHDLFPHSRLEWLFTDLGLGAILLAAAILVSLAIVLWLVVRGKGPAMVGVIMLVVPMPIYVALMCAISGLITLTSLLAMSDSQDKLGPFMMGIAEALVHIEIGVILTIPAFLLATIGLIVRALQRESTSAPSPLATK